MYLKSCSRCAAAATHAVHSLGDLFDAGCAPGNLDLTFATRLATDAYPYTPPPSPQDGFSPAFCDDGAPAWAALEYSAGQPTFPGAVLSRVWGLAAGGTLRGPSLQSPWPRRAPSTRARACRWTARRAWARFPGRASTSRTPSGAHLRCGGEAGRAFEVWGGGRARFRGRGMNEAGCPPFAVRPAPSFSSLLSSPPRSCTARRRTSATSGQLSWQRTLAQTRRCLPQQSSGGLGGPAVAPALPLSPHSPRLPCASASCCCCCSYELLNEPWPGDTLADPLLLLPGVADKRNLQPCAGGRGGGGRWRCHLSPPPPSQILRERHAGHPCHRAAGRRRAARRPLRAHHMGQLRPRGLRRAAG